jgi:hypothetical protein
MNESYRDPSTGTRWNNPVSAALGEMISRMTWEDVAYHRTKPELHTPPSQPKPNFVPSADLTAPRAFGFGKAATAVAAVGAAALLLSWLSSRSKKPVAFKPEQSSN